MGSGPMLLYTGNEGPVETYYDNSGFMFELAKEFNALVVFIEHVSELPFGTGIVFEDRLFLMTLAILWQHTSLWTHRVI